MQLTFWWDNGNIDEWDSTYLSFQDGIVMQGGCLLLSNIEEEGIVFRPRYVNKSAHRKNLIEHDIVLVPPEDVPHLLRVEKTGWTVLQANGEGGLVHVALHEHAQGKDLAQAEPLDPVALYSFDPETGEMLDDDGGEYAPDMVAALIDESFEELFWGADELRDAI